MIIILIIMIMIISIMIRIHLKGKLSKWNPPGAIRKGGRLAVADTVASRQNKPGL